MKVIALNQNLPIRDINSLAIHLEKIFIRNILGANSSPWHFKALNQQLKTGSKQAIIILAYVYLIFTVYQPFHQQFYIQFVYIT